MFARTASTRQSRIPVPRAADDAAPADSSSSSSSTSTSTKSKRARAPAAASPARRRVSKSPVAKRVTRGAATRQPIVDDESVAAKPRAKPKRARSVARAEDAVDASLSVVGVAVAASSSDSAAASAPIADTVQPSPQKKQRKSMLRRPSSNFANSPDRAAAVVTIAAIPAPEPEVAHQTRTSGRRAAAVSASVSEDEDGDHNMSSSSPPKSVAKPSSSSSLSSATPRRRSLPPTPVTPPRSAVLSPRYDAAPFSGGLQYMPNASSYPQSDAPSPAHVPVFASPFVAASSHSRSSSSSSSTSISPSSVSFSFNSSSPMPIAPVSRAPANWDGELTAQELQPLIQSSVAFGLAAASYPTPARKQLRPTPQQQQSEIRYAAAASSSSSSSSYSRSSIAHKKDDTPDPTRTQSRTESASTGSRRSRAQQSIAAPAFDESEDEQEEQTESEEADVAVDAAVEASDAETDVETDVAFVVGQAESVADFVSKQSKPVVESVYYEGTLAFAAFVLMAFAQLLILTSTVDSTSDLLRVRAAIDRTAVDFNRIVHARFIALICNIVYVPSLDLSWLSNGMPVYVFLIVPLLYLIAARLLRRSQPSSSRGVLVAHDRFVFLHALITAGSAALFYAAYQRVVAATAAAATAAVSSAVLDAPVVAVAAIVPFTFVYFRMIAILTTYAWSLSELLVFTTKFEYKTAARILLWCIVLLITEIACWVNGPLGGAAAEGLISLLPSNAAAFLVDHADALSPFKSLPFVLALIAIQICEFVKCIDLFRSFRSMMPVVAYILSLYTVVMLVEQDLAGVWRLGVGLVATIATIGTVEVLVANK